MPNVHSHGHHDLAAKDRNSHSIESEGLGGKRTKRNKNSKDDKRSGLSKQMTQRKSISPSGKGRNNGQMRSRNRLDGQRNHTADSKERDSSKKYTNKVN